MSYSPDKPFSLMPEQHLLAELPEHWRQRFQQAIELMYESLEDVSAPAWADIAKRCSISPFHFHRMFRSVFFETPGQYLLRLRLQVAAQRLYEEPAVSVTDIAHDCGFSSSQALAKALRRELSCSAGEIRRLAKHGTLQELESLLMTLGHPQESGERCLEQKIAEGIPFTLETIPSRALCLLERSVQVDVHQLNPFAHLALPSDCPALVVTTDIDQIEKNFDEQRMSAGYFCKDSEANAQVRAGAYLCCHVVVDSDIGYAALWDAVFRHLMYNDVTLDESGCCVEIFDPPNFHLVEQPVTITAMLPVLTP